MDQRELRPLPPDAGTAAIVQQLNALLYMLRGLNPNWMRLEGFAGDYRDTDASVISSPNPTLFIKPAAGITAIETQDSAGNTTFVAYDGGVTMSEVLSNGNVKWKSGTAFTGELDHANTANRTYTFPDASGTLTVPVLGTWTPSLGGTATYTVTSGAYLKIGRLVTVWCALVVNAIGTGSQNTISGLPFQADFIGAGAVSQFASLAINAVHMSVQIPSSTSTAQIYATTVAGPTSALTNALTSGSTIVFTATYRTAS